MNFTHYRLGHVDRGSIVEVTLKGSAANVRLMDNSNFNSYKAGRQHRCMGGLAKRSPVRQQVPRSGNSHVAVDMQGLRGTVRSSIWVIPGSALRPLPVINEAPLRTIPTLVRQTLKMTWCRRSRRRTGGCSMCSYPIRRKTRMTSSGH